MTPSTPFARRANEGFVLVAVLWMLAALAELVSIYSSYTLSTAAVSHVADDRLQAEASIRSAVEMAAFRQLAGPDQELSGSFNTRVGRTRVTVQLAPETARIDLNAASVDLLIGLFTSVSVEPARAADLADRVIGWRTKGAPDKGAEAKLYAERHVPYGPRQAPFDNVLELSLLPGISPALVERLLPLVTIFNGHLKVDAASADPAVLSALPGMTPAILATVLKARSKKLGDDQGLLALFGPAKEYVSAGAPSEAIRAKVDVDFDNGRRIHGDVVFRLGKNDGEPYDILYWQDDFDGPASSA